MSDSTFRFTGLDDWSPEPFRTALARAGFSHGNSKAIGLGSLARVIREGHLIRETLPSSSRLANAVRLFLLGDTLPAEDVVGLLGNEAEDIHRIGLLEKSDQGVRSRFQVSPGSKGWIACDFAERQNDPSGDYVMGLGPSTHLLACLVPPCEQGRMLELGCGIAWLSQQFRASGADVVASDLNPRAIELARFNARLSSSEGIDFRQGDLFSAVRGEHFDRIAANLPYVQSPGGHLIHRESAAGEESICARALREVAEYLAPGGIAVALINWCHSDDDDWPEAPLRWSPSEGVRRWLFQTECASPADYARKWIRGDVRFDRAGEAREMRRWLDFYGEHRIRRISSGFIVLQQCSSGREWTETESRAAESIAPGAGEEVLRVLRNRTWLRDPHSDLLDQHYRTVPEMRAMAEMELERRWIRRTIRLTSACRLSYDGQIDENLLRLLELCAKGCTPADMVAEIRKKPEFSDIPDIGHKIGDLVRQLVHHGILIPSELAD
ncbi:methyltransferase [Haloferula helveola]|uniref:Methyltransferase n=1 Tax=Haloferula helveola TaxID=490095 RepID=A0ABM7RCD6_9BACT|nr:methyltransferase [Haloferula helveola]